MIRAEDRYPTAIAGRMNWIACSLKFSLAGTYVIGGIQPIHATRARMMTMPSQKDGMESPARLTTRST